MAKLVTEPSICIPRTLANVTWFQVKDTFEQLMGRGTVERVDIVAQNGDDKQPFCRIFVHFRYWPNTPEISAIRERLIGGEVLKVVYDTPWFWKCSASRIPKPVKTPSNATPYMEFTTNPSKTDDSRCTSPPKLRRSKTVDYSTPDTLVGENSFALLSAEKDTADAEKDTADAEKDTADAEKDTADAVADISTDADDGCPTQVRIRPVKVKALVNADGDVSAEIPPVSGKLWSDL